LPSFSRTTSQPRHMSSVCTADTSDTNWMPALIRPKPLVSIQFQAAAIPSLLASQTPEISSPRSESKLATDANAPLSQPKAPLSQSTAPLSQSQTATAADLIDSHTPVTMLRNVSDLCHAVTNAAARPTSARTISPLGFIAKTTLRAVCTAVNASVTPRTTAMT